jgi:hypothetical protein
LHIAVIAQIARHNGRLPQSAEIANQIDPSLMRLMLDHYFRRSIKDASLSSHGDPSMRHAQEKDAPLVNQSDQRLRPCWIESTMMAPLGLAILQSQPPRSALENGEFGNREPASIGGAGRRTEWRFDEGAGAPG